MLKNTLLLMMILMCKVIKSQTYVLSGIVETEEGRLSFGEVVLKSSEEALVYSTIIEDGEFEIPNLPKERYLMSIISLGYEILQEDVVIEDNLFLRRSLKNGGVELSEVAILARKQSISFKNGNVLVNVGESVLKNEATTTTLLSKLPGIIISPNGEQLSLVGRGNVLIYLRNRRLSLEELLAIQVAQIERIEIINNPSAKYEADGRSVINVILKDEINRGYSLNLNSLFAKRRAYNSYNGIGASVGGKKLEWRSNINFNQLGYWEGFSTDYALASEGLALSTDAKSTGLRQATSGNTGLFIDLKGEDYLSTNLSFRASRSKTPVQVESEILDQDLSSKIFTDDEGFGNRHFLTLNLNYHKNLEALGTSIFVGGQRSRYYRASFVNIHNTISGQRDFQERRDQDYLVKASSFRADFEKNLKKEQFLELGVNFLSSQAKGNSFFADRDQTTTLDLLYRYNERNLATYAQWRGSVQGSTLILGLRNESVSFKGQAQGESQPRVDQDMNNLFPHIEFQTSIDSTNSISVLFSASISRPNYLNASLISTYINPYLEYSRNPNLLPSPVRFVRFNFDHKKHNFLLEIFSRRNIVQSLLIFDQDQRRITQSPENYRLERGGNIAWNSSFEFKKWSNNNSFSVNYNVIEDDRGESIGASPYVYLFTNQDFRLGKGFNLNLNARWISERSVGLFENNSMLVIGSQVSKTLGKWVLSLQANDILRQMNFIQSARINSIDFVSTGIADAQGVSLSMRYSFQKSFKAKFKNKDVDESIDRMR